LKAILKVAVNVEMPPVSQAEYTVIGAMLHRWLCGCLGGGPTRRAGLRVSLVDGAEMPVQELGLGRASRRANAVARSTAQGHR
jgi:hypothetical protein